MSAIKVPQCQYCRMSMQFKATSVDHQIGLRASDYPHGNWAYQEGEEKLMKSLCADHQAEYVAALLRRQA